MRKMWCIHCLLGYLYSNLTIDLQVYNQISLPHNLFLELGLFWAHFIHKLNLRTEFRVKEEVMNHQYQALRTSYLILKRII